MDNYILNGRNPIIESDLIKWATWFERSGSERQVELSEPLTGVKVSTVFLGMDHGFGDEIMLFETMIFGGEHDGYCERYRTWSQAEKGHHKALILIFN